MTLCETLSGSILPSNRGLQAVWCTCASWCFVAWKGVVMLSCCVFCVDMCPLCRPLNHISKPHRGQNFWPVLPLHRFFESCASIKPACCAWGEKSWLIPHHRSLLDPCWFLSLPTHLGNCQHKRSHIWSNIRTHLQDSKLEDSMDFTGRWRVPDILISTEIGSHLKSE